MYIRPLRYAAIKRLLHEQQSNVRLLLVLAGLLTACFLSVLDTYISSEQAQQLLVHRSDVSRPVSRANEGNLLYASREF